MFFIEQLTLERYGAQDAQKREDTPASLIKRGGDWNGDAVSPLFLYMSNMYKNM